MSCLDQDVHHLVLQLPAEHPATHYPGRDVQHIFARRDRQQSAHNSIVAELVDQTELQKQGVRIVGEKPDLLFGPADRDVIALPDGRLAILTDSGNLLLIRNAELNGDNKMPLAIRGLETLPAPSIEESPPVAFKTRAQRGRAMFMSACASCHDPYGQPSAGPPLHGIVGRGIASIEAYGYSAALVAKKGEVWTPAKLTNFIDHPEAIAPGTSMPAPGIFHQDVADLIAYLGRQ